ncbi:hypothetical protein NDU88_006608 [Pleurodeles waltl]|uniref:Uncharacterized protein n=1 Tax=Pleurodeles waltl TaxID=8319 RepID=A0AAV7NTL7_PLEWA|nr:hypothetical protein NDU88_006608 [Pleurodeles waltl]
MADAREAHNKKPLELTFGPHVHRQILCAANPKGERRHVRSMPPGVSAAPIRGRLGSPPGMPPLLSQVQLVPPQRVPGAPQPPACKQAPALVPSHRFQASADRLWPARPDSPRLTLTPDLLPCCLGVGRSPRDFESSGVVHRIIKDLLVADRAR